MVWLSHGKGQGAHHVGHGARLGSLVPEALLSLRLLPLDVAGQQPRHGGEPEEHPEHGDEQLMGLLARVC